MPSFDPDLDEPVALEDAVLIQAEDDTPFYFSLRRLCGVSTVIRDMVADIPPIPTLPSGSTPPNPSNSQVQPDIPVIPFPSTRQSVEVLLHLVRHGCPSFLSPQACQTFMDQPPTILGEVFRLIDFFEMDPIRRGLLITFEKSPFLQYALCAVTHDYARADRITSRLKHHTGPIDSTNDQILTAYASHDLEDLKRLIDLWSPKSRLEARKVRKIGYSMGRNKCPVHGVAGKCVTMRQDYELLKQVYLDELKPEDMDKPPSDLKNKLWDHLKCRRVDCIRPIKWLAEPVKREPESVKGLDKRHNKGEARMTNGNA